MLVEKHVKIVPDVVARTVNHDKLQYYGSARTQYVAHLTLEILGVLTSQLAKGLWYRFFYSTIGVLVNVHRLLGLPAFSMRLQVGSEGALS